MPRRRLKVRHMPGASDVAGEEHFAISGVDNSFAQSERLLALIEHAVNAVPLSAASRFRDLILQGKLDDDSIFATVKAEYGLEDKKRPYVAWYRNELIRKGQLARNAPRRTKV